MSDSLNKKVNTATKWSVITEIVAKLITPITSMILARILAPEAFGILTTVLMVIAFAEVFVDSGFQKYLIQHIFDSEEQEEEYLSVAFWANLGLSLFIWGAIAFFNNQIAEMVGNPNKGYLIVITGVTIPLYGMIGIQNCKLRKKLDFKKLFYVRIASSLAPLVVTIPLALLGLDYWALIIGNIAGVLIRSITLAVVKSFKPKLFFSWNYLREMLSYTIWTILNGLAVWLTSWIDAFLIGRFLTDYYLGLYKNSTNLMTSIFGLVTASIVPVLFSALSQLQNDEAEFKKMFLRIQSNLCMFLVPLGAGLLLYRNFATDILLGAQWTEAVDIIGISAITTAIRTIYIGLNGDVFRAKGQFKVPLYLQLLDLIITVPACFIALRYGFWIFVYVRSITKILLVLPETYYLNKICAVTIPDQVRESWHYYAATIVMAVVAWGLHSVNQTMLFNFIGVIICMIVYAAILMLFSNEREKLKNMVNPIIKRISK
ncbi:oligosaccharide flippase family protein [Lactonifactor sp. BIOML-A3]|uniref:lipopolysaccharide biosynthesis protein n=1 Tax=unclassified Lactonifactor TaxID=2636670 RepID=UPI0012B0B29D|nr:MULTISPECIES: lipopolysaccharide biosynthesis protein [unclassified Lactonifactor]MSA01742.1 oligosaccharide flippase family protein [Lactonifactor sp. BIOML-A5]MSA08740.1 oligosaccharide flippase family protein [Lactonifactor sp. BIOML-A4]MSA13864.1 oligosaccharide flippase family protein [Lactonifactor sp. BIOML-A3]MSA17105.1 oligosaccharide flippase family protein [Lactonifactor sp. BIOML-A2]MSA37784.1 oligosaccharide flippase family protein [Lactonifactor sp. BIOML-A1]